MKECERISSLYGDLQDEHIDSITKNEALEHFGSCTHCREDFKWYRITVHALNNLEDVSPPKDFMVQLSSKLYATPPSRSYDTYLDFFRNLFSTSPHLPLPVGAASLAFLVVVGFVVYNNAPVEYLPGSPTVNMVKNQGAKPSTGAVMAVTDSGTMRGSNSRVARPLMPPASTTPSPHIPFHTAAVPKAIGPRVELAARPLNTIADRIGGDNLTVESPSVEMAVESIKRLLPNLQGKLVDEKSAGGIGEKVIGIRIPSSSYGHLTTELINHGAVASGAGSDAKTPAPAKAGSNTVILYIRFVQSH